MNYICIECGNKFPLESNQWKCRCNGLLHLEYDKRPLDFNVTALSKNHSLWKYVDSMPFEKEDCWNEVTMGEGDTPLILIDKNVYAKADYYMPTLSFVIF